MGEYVEPPVLVSIPPPPPTPPQWPLPTLATACSHLPQHTTLTSFFSSPTPAPLLGQ